jgi:signal transduction histidine kinase
MARVFSNLIINAINFTPSGGRVVVHTRQDAAAQYVDVADTGIGIPEEKQARLFESFYQVADPLTRSVGGLGIGLAYARRIVEAHGGRVTFASRPGEGSVFTVRLPAG